VSDNGNTFRTRNESLAALLRFGLYPDAHLSTEITIRGRALFTFRDEPSGTCRAMADDFFRDGSVNVNDARHLLGCLRSVQWTARKARSNGNIWTPEQAQPTSTEGSEQ